MNTVTLRVTSIPMADSTAERALQTIRSDLAAAAEQLRWAHNTAWWPTTTPTTTPTHTNPTNTDGPPWATGQPGDHTRRRLRQAIRRLNHLERTLDTALTLTAPQHHIPTTNPQPHDPHTRHHHTIVYCGVRCAILTAHAHHITPPARRLLEHATRTSGAMRSLLDSALGASPPTTTPPACWNCRIRTAEPRKGGRCSTCHAWKHRHGHERPRTLDGDHLTSIAEARAAKARARRRGEGWGAA